MRKAYVDIPEGQMHYRYAGNGSNAAIFLHMSGSSGDEYEMVGNLLAKRDFTVYAIDLLGFGSSDKPSHYYYYMGEQVDTVISFMDAMGIEKAYFYGNMATANLLAKLGTTYPERAHGIMMAHPLYNPDPDYYKRRGRTPGFCKVDPAEDGSHLKELWVRAKKYGDPAAISDLRCADMHKAGEWCETLHWALHEDLPFGAYLDKLTMKAVIVAYSFFGDPTLLKQAAGKLSNGAFDFYENATPYISRSEPERVVEMFCKYFPVNS